MVLFATRIEKCLTSDGRRADKSSGFSSTITSRRVGSYFANGAWLQDEAEVPKTDVVTKFATKQSVVVGIFVMLAVATMFSKIK